MTEFAITAFVTLFVIVDPVGNVPFFVALTPHATPEERFRIALRANIVAAALLVVFGFAGHWILQGLGIGLPAFRIGGGILLLLLAIEMVFARQSGLRSTTSGEDEEAAHRLDVAVFPLAVPLIAGPGALASILLLMGDAAGSLVQRAVLVAVLAAVFVANFATLVLGTRILARIGVTGINVLTRVFGVVLTALAVQFIIDGAKAAFGA